jgi:hypothetical protein
MKLTGGNRSTRGKTCPRVTLSTTNPTWTERMKLQLDSLLHGIEMERSTGKKGIKKRNGLRRKIRKMRKIRKIRKIRKKDSSLNVLHSHNKSYST